jgi:hypothetical protein
MPTIVHRPLQITTFNANGTGRQAYETRKQFQDLKIDMALFSETHLKPQMRFYIPNYDFYWTDREDGHKGGNAVAVKKKGIPHTCVDLPPVLSVEATGVYIPIGNTEMFLAAPYKSPQRLFSDIDITELLGFRNRSILAGDPVWSNKVSNPSGLKLLEVFVSSNFEISVPQCVTHYMSEGRGDILDIVVHQNVRLSEVIVTHSRLGSSTNNVQHSGPC